MRHVVYLGDVSEELVGVCRGQISRALDISRATVKWHMHNIFAKSNTGNRESLLRLALQLGGATRPPNGASEDDDGSPASPALLERAKRWLTDPRSSR